MNTQRVSALLEDFAGTLSDLRADLRTLRRDLRDVRDVSRALVHEIKGDEK